MRRNEWRGQLERFCTPWICEEARDQPPADSEQRGICAHEKKDLRPPRARRHQRTNGRRSGSERRRRKTRTTEAAKCGGRVGQRIAARAAHSLPAYQEESPWSNREKPVFLDGSATFRCDMVGAMQPVLDRVMAAARQLGASDIH